MMVHDGVILIIIKLKDQDVYISFTLLYNVKHLGEILSFWAAYGAHVS